MPGFGGFAAVPGGYNEAELNQQYVQALILDQQQKRQQQAAGGLAAAALGIGAGQGGPTLPGAQTLPPGMAPLGLPSGTPSAGVLPPPTQAPQAPGAGASGPPAGPAPGAPVSAPMPNAVAAGGMDPSGGSIIGASAGPTPPAGAAPGAPTLARIATQQNASPQAVASVAQTLSVQPNQPLSPTLADRAKQLLSSASVGAGGTVSPPGGGTVSPIPGAQPAPGAGGTPPLSGPIQPIRVQTSSIPGAQPPPGAGPPGGQPPQQLAQAGAPGQVQPGQLNWHSAIDWINQAAAQQEQATGRKVSPQEKWLALQQMVPLMNMDAQNQYKEALIKVREEAEATRARGEEDKRINEDRKREIDLMKEQNRYNAKREDLRIKQGKLEEDGRKIDEYARRTDLTTEQKKEAQKSLDAHRQRVDDYNKEYKAAEADHLKRVDDIKVYGIDVQAGTAAERTQAQRDIAAGHDVAAGERSTERTQAQRDIAAGHDVAAAERQRVGEEGKKSRQQTDLESKDRRQQRALDARAAADDLKINERHWEVLTRTETQKEISKLNREAKAELTHFVQGEMDERAELSGNLKLELKKLSIEAQKEIARYIEAGRMIRHEQTLTSREGIAAGVQAGRDADRQQREGQFRERMDVRAGEFDITQARHDADREQRWKIFQGSQEAKGLAREDVERRFQQREDRLKNNFATAHDDRVQAAKDRRDRLALDAAAKSRAGDLAAAKAAVDLWDKEARNYDRMIRAKISAMANLPARDKQEMLREIDAEFNQQLAAREQLKRGQPAAAAPAAGAPASGPAAAPTADTVRQNGHTYQRQPDGSYKAIE